MQKEHCEQRAGVCYGSRKTIMPVTALEFLTNKRICGMSTILSHRPKFF